jgi:hypothetical protein
MSSPENVRRGEALPAPQRGAHPVDEGNEIAVGNLLEGTHAEGMHVARPGRQRDQQADQNRKNTSLHA